jgi:hypothetical protein
MSGVAARRTAGVPAVVVVFAFPGVAARQDQRAAADLVEVASSRRCVPEIVSELPVVSR